MDKIMRLKPLIIEAVLWAETDLAGKSGAEKRRAVINKLAKLLLGMFTLPWWLSWAKSLIITRAIGYVVDLVCEKLNLLTNFNFGGKKLNHDQVLELSEVLEAPIDLLAESAGKTFDERLDDLYSVYTCKPSTQPTPRASADLSRNDIDDRVNRLYTKYNIKPDEVVSPPVASQNLSGSRNPDRLSANLTRSEIACKCGCGFDEVDQTLVLTFQALRDFIQKPIIITSGCRCATRNKKVNGVPNSGHISGQALDLYVCGLDSTQLIARIKEAYKVGLLPYLRYCYPMTGKKLVVHIGVDYKPARKSIFA